ncbi:MAG: hypothetical protein DDT29_01805 [Dehalococcoidia bacterium]|nr:hypothetical protein [Bacillota bacterium]
MLQPRQCSQRPAGICRSTLFLQGTRVAQNDQTYVTAHRCRILYRGAAPSPAVVHESSSAPADEPNATKAGQKPPRKRSAQSRHSGDRSSRLRKSSLPQFAKRGQLLSVHIRRLGTHRAGPRWATVYNPRSRGGMPRNRAPHRSLS